MANKKISELPYINVSEISGNTLVPLVTYFSAATGDTVHTYTSDLQNYIGGNYLPLTGGTVSGDTVFLDITGTVTSLDTANRELVDSSSLVSMDWQSRFLFDISGIKSVEYGGKLLNDGTGATSVDWENRLLYDSTGTQVFNWESGNLDVDYIQTSAISATTYLNLPAGFTGDYLPLSGGTVTGGTIFNSGLTATTFNISSTPTTDTGTTANYLTRDGSTGEIKVKTIPGPTVYGLFSQTGTSVAVSATTVETTLISGGVGSIIIPENGFSVGDSFHGVLIGHLSCVGSATLHIRIKTVSGALLAETGVMAMEAATNKHWKLDVSFTVRQVGAATVASIASGGLFAYTKNSGLNFEGVNFSLVENTTFNTTISNTLVVTAEWNTTNAGNSIYSEIFTLNKTY